VLAAGAALGLKTFNAPALNALGGELSAYFENASSSKA